MGIPCSSPRIFPDARSSSNNLALASSTTRGVVWIMAWNLPSWWSICAKYFLTSSKLVTLPWSKSTCRAWASIVRRSISFPTEDIWGWSDILPIKARHSIQSSNLQTEKRSVNTSFLNWSEERNSKFATGVCWSTNRVAFCGREIRSVHVSGYTSSGTEHN